MKNKLVVIVFAMLFFGYLGYSSNQSNSETISEFSSGFYEKSNNGSLTFLFLMIILIGCYVFREPLARITGIGNSSELSNSPSGNTTSEESPSEEETPSDEDVSQPSEEPIVDLSKEPSEEFEDKLKDKYLD